VFYIKARRSTLPVEESTHLVGWDNNTFPTLTAEDTTPEKYSVETKPTGLTVQKLSQERTDTFRVLLVEDNLINQDVLSRQLRKAGHIVHIANHGQEALEFLQTTNLWLNNHTGIPLDIVLMDIEMPVMNGIDCAQQMRKLQAQGSIIKHIPIIAVTANTRLAQIESCLAAGMASFTPVQSWRFPH
jgi:CheY-like chemotaxis protein